MKTLTVMSGLFERLTPHPERNMTWTKYWLVWASAFLVFTLAVLGWSVSLFVDGYRRTEWLVAFGCMLYGLPWQMFVIYHLWQKAKKERQKLR